MRTVTEPRAHFIRVITFYLLTISGKTLDRYIVCVRPHVASIRGCVYTANNNPHHINSNIYCLSIREDCQGIFWKMFGSLTRGPETERLWERSSS